MERYPLTVLEFEDMFPTEEACRTYLALVRWPEGFHCPRCHGTAAWRMGSGLYRCRQCRRLTSVTRGTIFQDTHTPLRLWFQAIWYVVNQKQGVSALGLQRALGLGSYHTAWAMLHKLRRAMVRPGRERLAGMVEVDETLIGGRRHGGRPGRSPEGMTLVLVGVEEREHGIGRIRLRVIPDASTSTLTAAVREMVERGSRVRTDGRKGYRGLRAAGYRHTAIERAGIADEDATPLVHRVSSLLKRWLLGTHQGRVQSSHLSHYLEEFTFRFNRRRSRSRGKLFLRLVEQAMQVAPVTGSALRAV